MQGGVVREYRGVWKEHKMMREEHKYQMSFMVGVSATVPYIQNARYILCTPRI